MWLKPELKGEVGEMVTMQQLQDVAAYSSRYLVRQLIAQPELELPGREERFYAAVLFSDVSGFTTMSENLAGIGRLGTEELTRVLNDYFEVMIRIVHDYSGVVARFGGDAITVFFPTNVEEELPTNIHAALACGLEMLAQMGRFAHVETAGGTFTLKMKTGVSAGPILALSVGSMADGLEHSLAGRALEVMAECEHHANPGELVVDVQTLNRVRGVITRRKEPNQFAVVLATPPMDRQPASLPWEQVTPNQLPRILQRLSWYLPATVYEEIMGGQTSFVNEHRRVTSMFVSFAGLDYDDAPEVTWKVQVYFTAMQRIIRRYGGRLNRLLTGDKGSTLHVFFGAPAAHEDDARRAVGCALEMARVVRGLPFIEEQRIGISTGLVFAGAVGTPARREYTIMGDEVNLSARLMQVAAEGLGTVVISAATKENLADKFVLRALGEITVKGKSEPVAVYEPIKHREVESRLRVAQQSEMVGRETERAVIRSLLEKVQAGQGQILTISGEAGVGKSRLAMELARILIEELHLTGFGGDCLSYGADAPYLPWTDVLTSFLGLSTQLNLDQRVQKVTEQLETIDPDLLIRLPLLSSILGLGLQDNDITRHFDARLHQQSTMSLVWDLLRHQAQKTPYLLLFEDAQWMDSLSWELIKYVARNMGDLPLMLVLVHRPFGDSLPAAYAMLKKQSYYTALILKDLTAGEMLELVKCKLDVADLPARLAEVLIRRGAGNPFFTEEILQTLRETRMIVVENGMCRLTSQFSEAVLPENVRAVVQARIDRLSEAGKLTLKVAAVIGRLFQEAVLAGIYPIEIPRKSLHRELERLTAREFTLLERPEPELEYLFKHLITQEVAYEVLPFAQRRRLHQVVGEFLEKLDSTAVEKLAYHYSHSDDHTKATHYLGTAGDKARREYANEVALDYYERALVRARRGAWLQGKVEVLHILGRREEERAALGELEAMTVGVGGDVAYLWGKYYEAIADYPQAQVALERALADYRLQHDLLGEAYTLAYLGLIARRQGEHDKAKVQYNQAWDLLRGWGAYTDDAAWALAQVLNGLGIVHRQQGHFTDAKTCYELALTLSRVNGNRPGEAEALNSLGSVASYQRHFTEALAYYQQALEVRRAIGDRVGEGEILGNLAQVIRDTGNYGQARDYLFETLTIYQTSDNRWGEVNTWNDLGILYHELGDLSNAQTCLQRGLTLAREIGDAGGQNYICYNLGLVLRDLGNCTAATQLLNERLVLLQKENEKYERSFFLSCLSTVNLQTKQIAQAITQAKDALQIRQEIGLHLNTTDDLAVLGIAYLNAGELEQALNYAQQALAILKECGGKGPEFPQRDYFMCYQVLSAAGREDEACTALQTAYDLVLARAENITDLTLRRMFLEDVAQNREIVETWQLVQQSKETF